MTELKPCPFCGGTANREEDELWTRHRFRIRCQECGASTDGYRSYEGAEEAWNDRVGDTLNE